MNGGDYVLDAIAEMEMPPAFPKNEGRHPFLVSIDHSKGQLPLIVDTEMLLREGIHEIYTTLFSSLMSDDY